MSKLKEARADILKCFAQENIVYYYDPSSMWRMKCDFEKILEKVKAHTGEEILEDNNLETQRTHIKLKTSHNWLVIDMI